MKASTKTGDVHEKTGFSCGFGCEFCGVRRSGRGMHVFEHTADAFECEGRRGISAGFVIYADEQILASFDSNPSTGFDWTVAIEGDALEQVGDKTFASSDKTGVATGAPGVMELVFKGLKAGTVVMIFKNARSWEDNVTDIYYRVKVTLGASGAVESMEGAELPNPLKVL